VSEPGSTAEQENRSQLVRGAQRHWHLIEQATDTHCCLGEDESPTEIDCHFWPARQARFSRQEPTRPNACKEEVGENSVVALNGGAIFKNVAKR